MGVRADACASLGFSHGELSVSAQREAPVD